MGLPKVTQESPPVAKPNVTNEAAPAKPVPEPGASKVPWEFGAYKPSDASKPTKTTAAPPAVATPAPVAPAPVAPTADDPRRPHSDSVSLAFDNAISDGTDGKQGTSTPQDLEAVRKVFHDVAVAHVAQVRDVMLELRFGEADPTWLESTRPALDSLRKMAAHLELVDLCTALDAFCAAVEASAQNRTALVEDGKAELLAKYQRLIELIPQAFELDAERDRREPIIVEALLLQIEGVERPTIDKLFAVGLNRLDALLNANVEDMVAVSGIRPALAEAIVEQFRKYRAHAKAAVSVRDPAAEMRELAGLLTALASQNDAFTQASNAWSDDAVARKRKLRQQREQTFQRIKVALARLGAREQLSQLEKLPFQDRIDTLTLYLRAQAQVR